MNKIFVNIESEENWVEEYIKKYNIHTIQEPVEDSLLHKCIPTKIVQGIPPWLNKKAYEQIPTNTI